MNRENFVKLCNIYDELKYKTSKFENSMETIFDGDTTVMLIWPAELSGNMLKVVLQDIGDSEAGANWFVSEGMDFIRKEGKTEIGVKEENKTYTITSYGDYYDFLVGDLQSSVMKNAVEGVKQDTVKEGMSWGEFIKEIKKEQR